MHLLPVDQSFYVDLERLSSLVVEAANALRDMTTAAGAPHPQARSVIGALQCTSDEIMQEFVQLLGKKFATPFDAEDLHELVLRLSNVISLIDGVAWRFDAFGIRATAPPASALATVLAETSATIDSAIQRLRDPRCVWVQTAMVKQYEEEGDALYFAAVSALLDPTARTYLRLT